MLFLKDKKYLLKWITKCIYKKEMWITVKMKYKRMQIYKKQKVKKKLQDIT